MVEIKTYDKATRGVAIGAKISLSKLELQRANIDLKGLRKSEASKSIGLAINNSLNIWDRVEDNSVEETLEARLLVFNEFHFKQMLSLVSTVLEESSISSVEANQVKNLIIGLIESPKRDKA